MPLPVYLSEILQGEQQQAFKTAVFLKQKKSYICHLSVEKSEIPVLFSDEM